MFTFERLSRGLGFSITIGPTAPDHWCSLHYTGRTFSDEKKRNELVVYGNDIMFLLFTLTTCSGFSLFAYLLYKYYKSM